MKYVLDTNVLLFYVRDDRTSTFIEENYGPFDAETRPLFQSCRSLKLWYWPVQASGATAR